MGTRVSRGGPEWSAAGADRRVIVLLREVDGVRRQGQARLDVEVGLG